MNVLSEWKTCGNEQQKINNWVNAKKKMDKHFTCILILRKRSRDYNSRSHNPRRDLFFCRWKLGHRRIHLSTVILYFVHDEICEHRCVKNDFFTGETKDINSIAVKPTLHWCIFSSVCLNDKGTTRVLSFIQRYPFKLRFTAIDYLLFWNIVQSSYFVEIYKKTIFY